MASTQHDWLLNAYISRCSAGNVNNMGNRDRRVLYKALIKNMGSIAWDGNKIRPSFVERPYASLNIGAGSVSPNSKYLPRLGIFESMSIRILGYSHSFFISRQTSLLMKSDVAIGENPSTPIIFSFFGQNTLELIGYCDQSANIYTSFFAKSDTKRFKYVEEMPSVLGRVTTSLPFSSHHFVAA